MSVFLVRGYSLAGAIRSIYLFPVPTLLLHDRKEINVCFIFLWNISGSWICCKILYKMQCRKTYRRFWVQLFPSYWFQTETIIKQESLVIERSLWVVLSVPSHQGPSLRVLSKCLCLCHYLCLCLLLVTMWQCDMSCHLIDLVKCLKNDKSLGGSIFLLVMSPHCSVNSVSVVRATGLSECSMEGFFNSRYT